jgi:hypothetical protein
LPLAARNCEELAGERVVGVDALRGFTMIRRPAVQPMTSGVLCDTRPSPRLTFQRSFPGNEHEREQYASAR